MLIKEDWNNLEKGDVLVSLSGGMETVIVIIREGLEDYIVTRIGSTLRLRTVYEEDRENYQDVIKS